MLDFGRFVLDSNAEALASLSEEEAANYLPFRLSGRDISAYLVDGAFSWSFMAGSTLTSVLAHDGFVQGVALSACDRIVAQAVLSLHPGQYASHHHASACRLFKLSPQSPVADHAV